jgi:hypothetical protein
VATDNPTGERRCKAIQLAIDYPRILLGRFGLEFSFHDFDSGQWNKIEHRPMLEHTGFAVLEFLQMILGDELCQCIIGDNGGST